MVILCFFPPSDIGIREEVFKTDGSIVEKKNLDLCLDLQKRRDKGGGYNTRECHKILWENYEH